MCMSIRWNGFNHVLFFLAFLAFGFSFIVFFFFFPSYMIAYKGKTDRETQNTISGRRGGFPLVDVSF